MRSAGWKKSPLKNRQCSSGAAGVLLLFNAEATRQVPAPDASCGAAAGTIGTVICASRPAPSDIVHARAVAAKKSLVEAGFLAERRPLHLFAIRPATLEFAEPNSGPFDAFRSMEKKSVVATIRSKLRDIRRLMGRSALEAEVGEGLRPAGAGRDRHHL